MSDSTTNGNQAKKETKMTLGDAKSALTLAVEAYHEAGMQAARNKVQIVANTIFTAPIQPTFLTEASLGTLRDDATEERKGEAEEYLITAMKAFKDVGDTQSMDRVSGVAREVVGEEKWAIEMKNHL